MTASKTISVEAGDTRAESRATWVAPRVTRMQAGKAEDGIDPNVADGLLTYS